MLKVKIILENELGEEISQKEYLLEGSMESFDEVEDSILKLSSAILPDLTKETLLVQQKEFIKKKTNN